MPRDTIGFNHYIGYCFPVSISENMSEIHHNDAGEYYKILFIKSGTFHFLLNKKEFILTGAHAICLNEQDEIEFFDTQNEVIRILWFKPMIVNTNFTYNVMQNPNRTLSSTELQDTFYLEQFFPGAELNAKIIFLRSIDSTAIEQKLKILKDLLENQNNNAWPCRSRCYLYEILFCLARQQDDDLEDQTICYDGSSRLAVDVIYYLQSWYNHKITIEKLANEFHTNRTTLLNEFKKYTGQSINRYLVQLRLTMASKLLRDTELSVDEICERTGFQDISYFSKAFKKGLNLTPSEYRKLYEG